MDMRELNSRAVLTSAAVVDRVDGDLGRRTPCAEWTLGDLLAHMIAQHRGFAAAARGAGEDLAVWEVRPLGGDPVGEYRAAVNDVLGAFGEEGVLERKVVLPEIGVTVPGEMAI